jgi:hypothetical protein
MAATYRQLLIDQQAVFTTKFRALDFSFSLFFDVPHDEATL